MKRKNIYRRILYGCILLMLLLTMTGCGGKDKNDKDTQTSQTQNEQKEELYMITGHDAMARSLCLRSLDTGLEDYYDYGIPTQFKDRYGNITSSNPFTLGRVVTIGDIDTDGYLTEVALSDKVWEYEKIKRFSIDEEKGIFTIADSKYSIRDKVFLFSNGRQIAFSSISAEDVLTVVGIDKKILSINVTTGHGILALQNTTIFEDSYLQLNQDMYATITENMQMELPEGEYTLKVANDGWGGTTQITIVRDEITEIDLDTLKGEGKKKGRISFEIDVEEVEVYIDYKLIDHTQPVELTYGTHSMQIKAEGYDTWKKYLSVNSQEATLLIELKKEDAEVNSTESKLESEKEETSESESESEKEESTESKSESEREETSESKSESEEEESTGSKSETEKEEISESESES